MLFAGNGMASHIQHHKPHQCKKVHFGYIQQDMVSQDSALRPQQ